MALTDTYKKFIIAQDGDVIKYSTQMSFKFKLLQKLYVINGIVIYHIIFINNNSK